MVIVEAAVEEVEEEEALEVEGEAALGAVEGEEAEEDLEEAAAIGEAGEGLDVEEAEVEVEAEVGEDVEADPVGEALRAVKRSLLSPTDMQGCSLLGGRKMLWSPSILFLGLKFMGRRGYLWK